MILDPNSPPVLSEREHLAHLVNHHGEFPVPATFQVEIKGHVGSIQLFLTGEKGPPEKADTLAFQKLLIFDLLFLNTDRHLDNILFIGAGENTELYGIDHDSCFCVDDGPLVIDYITMSPLAKPLHESLLPLISPENLEKYKQTLQDIRIAKWIDTVAEALNNAYQNKTPLNTIAEKLMQKFSDEYLN